MIAFSSFSNLRQTCISVKLNVEYILIISCSFQKCSTQAQYDPCISVRSKSNLIGKKLCFSEVWIDDAANKYGNVALASVVDESSLNKIAECTFTKIDSGDSVSLKSMFNGHCIEEFCNTSYNNLNSDVCSNLKGNINDCRYCLNMHNIAQEGVMILNSLASLNAKSIVLKGNTILTSQKSIVYSNSNAIYEDCSFVDNTGGPLFATFQSSFGFYVINSYIAQGQTLELGSANVAKVIDSVQLSNLNEPFTANIGCNMIAPCSVRKSSTKTGILCLFFLLISFS